MLLTFLVKTSNKIMCSLKVPPASLYKSLCLINDNLQFCADLKLYTTVLRSLLAFTPKRLGLPYIHPSTPFFIR